MDGILFKDFRVRKASKNQDCFRVMNAKYQQAWVEVKKKYRLSAATIEKAMKLGLNPRKLGSLANHKQEPLPDFIDALYEKRFNLKAKEGSKI